MAPEGASAFVCRAGLCMLMLVPVQLIVSHLVQYLSRNASHRLLATLYWQSHAFDPWLC